MEKILLLAALSLGCGPKDVIPSAPNHPANPEAATPTASPPSATPDASPTAAPHGGHGGDDKSAIAAAEKAAFERAKPIFEKHCAKCHTAAGKKAKKKSLEHFSMDAYPFGGHHAGEMGATIREVLGASGKEPTMPLDSPGAVKGAELDAIVEWSKAFDRSHAAGLHQHEGHHGGHR